MQRAKVRKRGFMVTHYHIFDTERGMYWMQNQFGYCFERSEAGKWTLKELQAMGLEFHLNLIPFIPEEC